MIELRHHDDITRAVVRLTGTVDMRKLSYGTFYDCAVIVARGCRILFPPKKLGVVVRFMNCRIQCATQAQADAFKPWNAPNCIVMTEAFMRKRRAKGG